MPTVTRTVAKGIAPRVREPNPGPKAKKKKPARKRKQVSSESESESEESEPVKRRKRKRQRMESESRTEVVDEEVEAPEVNMEEEDAGPERLAPEDETEVGQIVHTN
jgi:uncharacterized protein with WD repeat